MYSRILKRMRELVCLGQFVMTTHADEEADGDGLSVLDVENVILTGSIFERQKDRETSEWKYALRGQAIDGTEVVVVAKFGLVARLYVLTVHAE